MSVKQWRKTADVFYCGVQGGLWGKNMNEHEQLQSEMTKDVRSRTHFCFHEGFLLCTTRKTGVRSGHTMQEMKR